MTFQNGDLVDNLKEKVNNISLDSKKNNLIKLKTFIIVGLIIFITVILILKFTFPDFSWKIFIPLMIVSVLSIIFIVVIPIIKNREVKEKITKELPKPIKFFECQEIAENALKNDKYCNEINQCLSETIETLPLSQNIIYHYTGEIMYKTKHMNKGIVHILINMNFPDMRCILIDPTDYLLNKKINSLGNQTEKEIPLEEIETRNDILGITQISKKPSIKEKVKEKEEGDLE